VRSLSPVFLALFLLNNGGCGCQPKAALCARPKLCCLYNGWLPSQGRAARTSDGETVVLCVPVLCGATPREHSTPWSGEPSRWVHVGDDLLNDCKAAGGAEGSGLNPKP
jgi:hypothetical protein